MVFRLLLNLIPTYGNLTRLAALMVGLVLPTFKSFEAIESHDLDDDKQWLTYWVCYATLLSVETVAWSFLIWLPFYRLMRVFLLAWLALPQFQGAAFVYEQFVRPFLLVAVQKAREVPSLEPYLRNFSANKPVATASMAPSTSPSAQPATSYDALKREAEAIKREAMQKIDETFDKAKQPAVRADTEEEEQRSAYQPLKAHAQ